MEVSLNGCTIYPSGHCTCILVQMAQRQQIIFYEKEIHTMMNNNLNNNGTNNNSNNNSNNGGNFIMANNTTEVAPDEVLSDNVYRYDIDTDRIEMV